MHSVYDVLDVMLKTRERSVLATVIHVKGSAYRKEGTSMLFLENGDQIGTISAGCLETDLSIRAKKLFLNNEQTSYSITYDTRIEDDLAWGRGTGCNGIITVLLEQLTPSLYAQYKQVQEQLDKQTSVKLIKYMHNYDTIIDTICVSTNDKLPNKQSTIANHLTTNNHQKHVYIEGKSQADPNIFIQSFEPKRRLFIFGAGPDVIPLASIADQVDFSVHVWDWRPTYINKTNYPNAHICSQKDVGAFMKDTTFNRSDSVIIMTHDFQKDREILSYIDSFVPLKYVGVLGPRKRTKRLLQMDSIPAYLHSPVGKDIGAEGPAEIAISIISDLIDAQRERLTNEKPMNNQTKIKRTGSST